MSAGFQVEEEQMLEMWVKEETSATRANVLEKWTRLQGLPQHQAMLNYMSIIKEWPGYGSTLFDVEVRTVLTVYYLVVGWIQLELFRSKKEIGILVYICDRTRNRSHGGHKQPG